MDHSFWSQMLIAVLGALGGFEFIKFAVLTYRNRKTDIAKEKTSVVKEQVNLLDLDNEKDRKQIEWLEGRIKDRDEKVDYLYSELRKEQEGHINTERKLHEVELKLKELEVRRCDVRGCSMRQPPSEFL